MSLYKLTIGTFRTNAFCVPYTTTFTASADPFALWCSYRNYNMWIPYYVISNKLSSLSSICSLASIIYYLRMQPIGISFISAYLNVIIKKYSAIINQLRLLFLYLQRSILIDMLLPTFFFHCRRQLPTFFVRYLDVTQVLTNQLQNLREFDIY